MLEVGPGRARPQILGTHDVERDSCVGARSISSSLCAIN